MDPELTPKRFYIRTLDIQLFNLLYAFLSERDLLSSVQLERREAYYTLSTEQRDLWHELFLYAQYIAQSQDSPIEGGEF